jgi:hypothetical protein
MFLERGLFTPSAPAVRWVAQAWQKKALLYNRHVQRHVLDNLIWASTIWQFSNGSASWSSWLLCLCWSSFHSRVKSTTIKRLECERFLTTQVVKLSSISIPVVRAHTKKFKVSPDAVITAQAARFLSKPSRTQQAVSLQRSELLSSSAI